MSHDMNRSHNRAVQLVRPPRAINEDEILQHPPMDMSTPKRQKPSKLSRIPSLHLPAIILFSFANVLQAVATFLPYWSIYTGIPNSRAGLWSAQNFNYFTIQNFYFPQPNEFRNLTSSIKFTTANTKGYLVTVQFLMTFNFCCMLIVLVSLIFDYIYAATVGTHSHSFLIRNSNTSDTVFKYGLLLYIIYVFGVFECAAWVTYIVSRHNNGWKMSISFTFAIIVSIFLLGVFIMYAVEFFKTFHKNRARWDYWYGPYIEWGFFIYLSALILLLLAICCPEWAYKTYNPWHLFMEIGLFKQCYAGPIYQKSLSDSFCAFSDSGNNQSWVSATQACMLLAYILGMAILAIIVAFRKEFRHSADGYFSEKFSQPRFTFIIASLILLFCFVFTLAGVAIFGVEVFKYSINANWGFIVAVISMIFFLLAGVLFMLDAIHSAQQKRKKKGSSVRNFFFPAPLSHRIFYMNPLLQQDSLNQPLRQFPKYPQGQVGQNNPVPWQQMAPYTIGPQAIYPTANFMNTPVYSQEQMPMVANYDMQQYPSASFTQAALAEYMRQMENNPQISYPQNQGFMNYPINNQVPFQNNEGYNPDNPINDVMRQHFLQQQRLYQNHERLLERYVGGLSPYASELHGFGTSVLPGRDYDQHMRSLYGNNHQDSTVFMSRTGVGASDDAYRWYANQYSGQPLPTSVQSVMQYNRDGSQPYVNAEKPESNRKHDHQLVRSSFNYIRSLFNRTADSERRHHIDEQDVKQNYVDHRENINMTSRTIRESNDEILFDKDLREALNNNERNDNEHFIPTNSHLFNMYMQRTDGSIEGYGLPLYASPTHYMDQE